MTVRWRGNHRAIDEEDFGVIKRIAAPISCHDDFYFEVTEGDARIFEISIPSQIAIPDTFFRELTKLSALKRLNSSYRTMRSLPPSIGLLQNLEILQLEACDLQDVPEEIGYLVNLKLLNLGNNPITSLPNSIGNLKNLERLDLFATDITKIPDVCWKLIKLRYFDIDTNHKVRIPPMIERLENLESFGFNLTHNPAQEMPNMPKLRNLWITPDGDDLPLPNFMENLKGLRCLYIDGICDFSYRQFEFVKLFPKLERFYVSFDGYGDCSEILLELVQANPSIVDVSSRMLRQLESNLKQKVLYALSCNRCRRRSPFRSSAAYPLLEKLWPQLLRNADRLFDIEKAEFERDVEVYTFDSWFARKEIYHDIGRHDAVYSLLSDGRDHFVQMLLNRSSYSKNSISHQ